MEKRARALLYSRAQSHTAWLHEVALCPCLKPLMRPNKKNIVKDFKIGNGGSLAILGQILNFIEGFPLR